MNRDDIIRMAREADFFANEYEGGDFAHMYYESNFNGVIEDLTKFAALVAAAERDAMKPRKWTEDMRYAWHQSIPDLELAFDELIRARGQE